jgi:DNA-binding MarR family transcriptional regulator
LKEKAALKEVPIVDRKIDRPDSKSPFSESNRTNKSLRNQVMRAAHFEYAHRQKEIADHLGLHYTTVSNIIRKKA